MAGQTIYSCQICREHKERGGIRSADSVREPVVEVIRKEYSGWSEKGYICTADLNRFRARYVRKILEKEREYYTKFAQALPKDTVILTAGCAKYRYNSLNLGTIGGIPRVLDAGQCNDCYSLVVIAQELAKAFGVGINELPVSYNIAWYEQKAVLVLLSLLSLGVKDITLGPKLPGFVSPVVPDVLVKNFDLKPNTTVEVDMARMVPAQ